MSRFQRFGKLSSILAAVFSPAALFALSISGSADGIPAGSEVVLSSVNSIAKSTAEQARAVVDDTGAFTLTAPALAGIYEVEVGAHKVLLALAGDESVDLQLKEGQSDISGAPHQTEFEAYERFRKASLARLVYPVRGKLREARGAGDQDLIERLTELEISEYAAHRRELNDFTIAEIGATPALLATALRWDGDYRREELAELVAEFQNAFPKSPAGNLMAAQIARFEALALGAVAPALEGPAPDGQAIKLSDYRGQWVLIDFWASWCPPCRIENKHYAELYQRFHDDGFEIFAVSVDHQGAGWKRAIRQDQADWVHLSDLSGWKSPLAAAYSVSALPASFLLDPDGRIVAKDLRGDALARKLAEVLGQP